MSHCVEILALSTDAAPALAPTVREVYQCAFATTDEEASVFIDRQFLRHVGYLGFRGFLAVQNEQVIGFAYGYESQPGGWWHDMVSPALVRAGLSDWLQDAFEFVEIAVVSHAHGQGVGGRLHDALLQGVTQQTALLSTGVESSNAQHLYRARGWISLIDSYRYAGQGEPVQVMGLRLPFMPSEPTQ